MSPKSLRLTTLLRWERDQNVARGCGDDAGAYHIAPVGARSKQPSQFGQHRADLTTLLRWERDQNMTEDSVMTFGNLPHCSGGSEIKTACDHCRWCPASYHIAPVGARSKHANEIVAEETRLTTLLRWERDQNSIRVWASSRELLPHCSGGSEIKT